MRVSEGIAGLRSLPPGSALSIGNFDGLHLGHAALLQRLRELRDATPGSRLAVVTFEPHPLTVLRPQSAPPRLTPPPVKRKLLESAGVDELVVLAPTREVLDLTAEQFWTVLRDHTRPAHIVEGGKFNFGKDRAGTIDRLRQWTSEGSIQLHIVESVNVALCDLQVVEVSSSLIRWLISYGRVRDAAICLGRAYALRGEVVKGHGRGRTIGVPTVNLRCVDQLIPADGVYAGRCIVDETTYPAAVSIGTMPTFGDNPRQIEAHLIGFSGDIYGQTIEIEIHDWLREQVRFAGLEPLKQQMQIDFARTNQRMHCDPQRPVACCEMWS